MLKRDIHRRGRRAVFRGGERSGVAVRENAVPVVQKSKAQFADGAADGNVLVADALRLRKKNLADGRDALTGVRLRRLPHPVERPEEIHRRRAGGGKIFLRFTQAREKDVLILRFDLRGGQRERIARAHTNGRCAAHAKQIDRLPDIAHIRKMQRFHLAGQQRLIQNFQTRPVR